MSPSRDRARPKRTTISRIDVVGEACRPMADYLFNEALGPPPSADVLRVAKQALLPLRVYPGRIGWAAMTLLEGGETWAAYEEAVALVLRAARGSLEIGSARVDDRSGELSAPVIALGAMHPYRQLVLPGLEN